MAPAAPPPTLYLESSPVEKQRREHAFNVVEVPRLRLLGFAIVTLLVVVRRLVMPEEPDAHPLLLGAIVFGYSLASWGILYLFFDRVRRINLGIVFLSIDVVAFIVAMYLTGAEKSSLFYLLFIRTADQTNTRTNAQSWLEQVARGTRLVAAKWTAERTPGGFIERHRIGARFAALPAPLKEEALRRLAAWAETAFGSLDSVSAEPHEFELQLFKFL